MERRQNDGQKCRIVREFVKNIADDTQRLVCFLYMRGFKDGAVCRHLKIDREKLQRIKTQLAFDLLRAGIRISEA